MRRKAFFYVVCCYCSLICFMAGFAQAEAGGNNGKIDYPAYMQGIDYGKETTYVIGHNPPDSDTVCTAIAYANLKRQLGVNAEARIASRVNAETAYALKYFGVEVPKLLEDAAGKNVILVDHSSFAQAVKGMKDANILEVLDHHNIIGDIKTSAPIYYRNLPVGCTSTIVWLEYQEANVPIEKTMAGMMLSAILSDTDNLQSSTTTDLDRQAVAALEKKAGLKDRGKYFLAMEEDLAAYKDMSDRDIFYSDYKEFEVDGVTYGCATVVALTPDKRKALEDRLGKWVQQNYGDQKMDMLFLKIHDLESYQASLSCYGEGALESAEAAFGKGAGNVIALGKNISRKKVVRLLQPEIGKWSKKEQEKKAA